MTTLTNTRNSFDETPGKNCTGLTLGQIVTHCWFFDRCRLNRLDVAKNGCVSDPYFSQSQSWMKISKNLWVEGIHLLNLSSTRLFFLRKWIMIWKTGTHSTPKLVSKFVMVTNLVLVPHRLSARAHFYEQLAMVVGRARLPWEFLIHNYIGEHLCTNLCILCRLCDRRHTFTAHSATVISKGQSNVEMRCIAVLATVSDDPRSHSQPFYCSHCVLQSLDVLKFSPPLSLVCPQFSPPPRLAPDESLLCSPVLAYLPPGSMQAEQSNAPHSVAQTPILAELPRVRWQSKQWKPGIPSPVELSLC